LNPNQNKFNLKLKILKKCGAWVQTVDSKSRKYFK
jgi:hypothetical protein